MDYVILVDKDDRAVGVCEKLEAHRKNLLHRAFSVLLYNNEGRLLLQKRAKTKYHSGGLLTNACCSHPAPGETSEQAAIRRLQEELLINTDSIQLELVSKMIYQIEFENGLSEHELDYIYLSKFDGEPKLNSVEAEAYIWKTLKEIQQDIADNPDDFTFWFKKIVNDYYEIIEQKINENL